MEHVAPPAKDTPLFARASVAIALGFTIGCVATGSPAEHRAVSGSRSGVSDYDSDCCEPSDTGRTGCDAPACETAVCDEDSYCCGTEWDNLCADFAIEVCGACEEGTGATSTTGTSPPEEDPIAEDEAVCCVQRCCETAQGFPTVCDAKPILPFPSVDPNDFDCPVEDMEYMACDPGDPDFDCDDFSYACKMWGDLNGVSICQTHIAGYEKGTLSTFSHAINIVEFAWEGDVNTKYCFIEPQFNAAVGCWVQPVGEPKPPSFALKSLETAYGLIPGTLDVLSIWCEPLHAANAGEACFTTDPGLCALFEEKTGLCADTFDVLPPPPPPEETVQCAGINGNNEGCYWDCPAYTECSETCYLCEGLTPTDAPSNALGFTNPSDCFDVDDDGEQTPYDALQIINYLNAGGELTPDGSGPPYYDVSADAEVNPLDALLLINLLNGVPQACGEG